MRLLTMLRDLNRAEKMSKDDVLISRQRHKTDPRKDRTVIIIHGTLDARKAADIEGIIRNTRTGHVKPKKRGARQMMIVEGQG